MTTVIPGKSSTPYVPQAPARNITVDLWNIIWWFWQETDPSGVLGMKKQRWLSFTPGNIRCSSKTRTFYTFLKSWNILAFRTFALHVLLDIVQYEGRFTLHYNFCLNLSHTTWVVLCKSSTRLAYVVVAELCAWFTQYNSSCKQVACDSFKRKLCSVDRP
jgi:hypothetical protein